MSIDINALKEITAAAIFIVGLLSVLLPLSIMNTNDSLFSIGNMMASGVLLAAGLTHQLPDSSKILDNGKFPFSTFITGLTFIVILIIEESVHLLFNSVGDDGSNHHGDGGTTGGAGGGGGGCYSHDHERLHLNSSLNGSGRHHGHGHGHHHGGEIESGDSNRQQRQTQKSSSHRHNSYQHDHSHGEGTHQLHHHHHPHSHSSSSEKQPLFPNPREYTTASSSLVHRSISVCSETQRNHHHHDEHIAQHLHGSLLASSVLLLSLSIHSTLAGLSIGIAPTTTQVTSTAVAILAHKMFEGYALGSSMVTADMVVERHFVLGTIFSLMAPLGIIIGMSLTYHEEDDGYGSQRWLAIVQAMVAGTFLYVAIVEVGMKELLICRHDDEFGSLGGKYMDVSVKQVEAAKLFFFLVGFLAMSSLAYYI